MKTVRTQWQSQQPQHNILGDLLPPFASRSLINHSLVNRSLCRTLLSATGKTSGSFCVVRQTLPGSVLTAIPHPLLR